MGILERAALVPLTREEIEEARDIIEDTGVCIANIQRRMRIGWCRAADLAEALVGWEALPEVARLRQR